MSDVWIEVNECREELKQFYATTATVVPGYGSNYGSVAQFVVKFNLSAYVRHEIARALAEAKEPA